MKPQLSNLVIRPADRKELDWINDKYAEIDFAPSDMSNEFIVIAELNGQRVGLGRLVTIDETTAELGGMYVFQEFQGLGIAGKIVQYLLQRADKFKKIYCLPFSELIDFYGKYGFKPIDKCQDSELPDKISTKLGWCKDTYQEDVVLLLLEH